MIRAHITSRSENILPYVNVYFQGAVKQLLLSAPGDLIQFHFMFSRKVIWPSCVGIEEIADIFLTQVVQ